MCPCNGSGRILEGLFAGVINFIPCSCKVAEIRREARQKEYAEFELKLVVAEQEWSRVYGEHTEN